MVVALPKQSQWPPAILALHLLPCTRSSPIPTNLPLSAVPSANWPYPHNRPRQPPHFPFLLTTSQREPTFSFTFFLCLAPISLSFISLLPPSLFPRSPPPKAKQPPPSFPFCLSQPPSSTPLSRSFLLLHRHRLACQDPNQTLQQHPYTAAPIETSRCSPFSNRTRRPGNYLPSPPQLQRLWTTATTRSVIDRRKNEPGGKENRDLWTYLKTKIYCLCVFLLLQVTVVLTAGRKVKRGGSRSRSPCCVEFLAVAREPTRRQWRWRVEKTRRHYSRAQKPSSILFLHIPKGFGFFRVYFVMLLKCIWFILNFL